MKDDAMCRWAACLITALLAGLCPLTAAQDASPGATSIESSAEKALWLSQLDLSKAQQECWPAQPDRAITGEALSIAGQKFEKGVGSHANSTLRVRLHGSLDVRRAIEALPLTQDEPAQRAKGDWLVHAPEAKASVYRRAHPDEIELANGLIRRVFRLAPNAATVGFDNLMTGETVIRGVKPEAIVEIDGKRYSVGGLLGQPDYAFLNPAWLGQMTSDPEGFEFVGFEVGATRARFPWKRVRHAPDAPWPPPGAALTLHFLQPNVPKASAVAVSVHYELYDGIPLLCKWFTIRNSSERNIRLSSFVSEILAVVESEQDIMLQPPSPNGEHDAQMPEKSVCQSAPSV